MNQQRISFAGAGRVGGALCRGLFHAGFSVDLIVSETAGSGRLLAESCRASWSSDLIFPDSTDIIIVAVPDHRLKGVLEAIRCRTGTLIAHTAGSFGLDIFPELENPKGIIYPLQTFSPGRDVSLAYLPFFLEASDGNSSEILKGLVDSVGGKANFSDTERRRKLHLAAVFVCNFTNHMITEGKNISDRAGFSFEVLKPLINETISKALAIGPDNAQTGPAIRNDRNTIEKHLDLLSFSPELQSLYKEVTRSIVEYYKDKI
jgi:predicted short-subunit dehydrogenase-like oxidoreductase (DUF2520 family)